MNRRSARAHRAGVAAGTTTASSTALRRHRVLQDAVHCEALECRRLLSNTVWNPAPGGVQPPRETPPPHVQAKPQPTTQDLGTLDAVPLNASLAIPANVPFIYAKFNVARPAQVTFALGDATNSPAASLLDGSGKTIAQFGTSSPLTASLDRGTYTIRLSRSNQALAATFRLNIKPAAGEDPAPDRVEAQALGGNGARVIWQDNSDNELGYRIDVLDPRSNSWKKAGMAGTNHTAGIVEHLQPGQKYQFRVVGIGKDRSGAWSVSPSLDSALVSTASAPTQGWYQVSSVSGVKKGYAGWALNSGAVTQNTDEWVSAADWSSAVLKSLGGALKVEVTSEIVSGLNIGEIVTHHFPSGGDILVGTGEEIAAMGGVEDFKLPADETKYVVVEDTYGGYDHDYDDWYWTTDGAERQTLDSLEVVLANGTETRTAGHGQTLYVVDEDGVGKAYLNSFDLYQDSDQHHEHTLWELRQDGNEVSWGDFSSPPHEISCTVGNGSRSFEFVAGFDDDADGYLGDHEIMQQIDVVVVKLHTMAAASQQYRADARSEEPVDFEITEWITAETEGGTPVTIDALVLPDDPAARKEVLWTLEGSQGLIGSGTFETAITDLLWPEQNENRTFTLRGGFDDYADGTLHPEEVTRTIIITLLPPPPIVPGDQVSLSSNHRVDIHGVPLPDPSPTGDGESDRLPNMAYVDAYSLTPSFSTTDVAVPMPGGELLMEFRRTLGIHSRITHPNNPQADFQWASENILGPGWSANIGSRVILTHNPKHRPDEPEYRATVYDEVGNPVSYKSNSGTAFIPDVRSSFSNVALRGKLETDVTYDGVNYDFAYTKTYGTRLFFKYTADYDRGGDVDENYYRLERIVDRNGNELRFHYDSGTSTLVAAIYDPALGDHATSDRRITFAYETDPNKPKRLLSVTDPLGRTHEYEYLNGRLAAVSKPDPDGGNDRPEVSFEYEVSNTTPRVIVDTSMDMSFDWTIDEYIKWTMPSKIIDARGHETSFTYDFRLTPTAVQEQNGLPVWLWENKPRVETVTTADGTATFDELRRTHTEATTTATDTRGITTKFEFDGDYVKAVNDLGFAIAIDSVKRSVDVTDVDGNTETQSAHFRYSRDINGNLEEVTDMSGNKVRYEYESGEAGDPFDAKPAWARAGTTYYALFNQPARSILDYDDSDDELPHWQEPTGSQDPRKDDRDPDLSAIDAADSLNLTTEYRYDVTFNKLIKQIDAEGKISEFTLDQFGNRTHLKEAVGTANESTTVYTYDTWDLTAGDITRGFVSKITDPDGRVTEYIANDFGHTKFTVVKGLGDDLTAETVSPFASLDPSAHYIVSRREADVMDRTLWERDPRGSETTYAYDDWDRVTAVTLPAVIDSTNPNGAVTSTAYTTYDANSNVLTETDHRGNTTIHEYDDFNRRISTTLPGNIVRSWDYDAVGLVSSETDPLGRVTQHRYDAMLRLIETTLPAVTEVTDPGSTASAPATEPKTYKTKLYYGENSGSGAFTFGGFNPTRVVNARGYATDTEYDDAYRAVKTIRRGNTSTAEGAPAASNEPVTLTGYNKVHKPLKVTVLNGDSSGDRSTYTFYDHRHRPVAAVLDFDGDGAGATAGTYYASADDFTGDAEDITTKTKYDLAGNARFVIDPKGRVTETQFDGAGRAKRVILPAVDVFTNSGGLVTGVQPQTSTVYDAASNPVLAVDAAGTATRTEFDARNRAVRTILDHDGDGTFDPTQAPAAADIVTTTGYDLNGNAVFSVDPNGNRVDTSYDALNRPTQVQGAAVADAENGGTLTRPTTVTVYDAAGNVISLTDPRGIVTKTEYDEWNRARKVIAAFGTADAVTTETRYDANGNARALVLHNKVAGVDRPQVTTYAYDAFDRQTSETLPSIGDGHTRQTTTTYSRAGDALSVTDPKGQKIESDYDGAGRVFNQRFKRANNTIEETRFSAYDKAGNLLSRSDKHGTSTYAYDALNRITSETRETTTAGIADEYEVQSFYDISGNRTKVVYPAENGTPTGRVLTSTYDRANRMLRLFDGWRLSEFTYDAAGNRLSHTQPNGVLTTSSFDAANRVTAISAVDASSTPIYALTYAYDRAGNRRSSSETVASHGTRAIAWDYDNRYQLTSESWTGPQAQTRTYTYDLAGNRLTRTIDATASGGLVEVTASVYDDLNQLVTSTTGLTTTTYTHDKNGNRVGKNPAGTVGDTSYTYDVSDRLVSVDVDSDEVFSAAYDARTRRLAKTEGATPATTLFRYDAGTNFQELQDLDSDGQSDDLATELIRAGGLGGGIGSVLYSDQSMRSTPGPVEHFIYNAVGHTTALTNGAGATTQTSLYEAFGDRVATSGSSTNNRLANTKERDASIGLDNHGFRYYDPETGRYITRDPMGYGDGMNVYQSVRNNAMNAVDAAGLFISYITDPLNNYLRRNVDPAIVRGVNATLGPKAALIAEQSISAGRTYHQEVFRRADLGRTAAEAIASPKETAQGIGNAVTAKYEAGKAAYEKHGLSGAAAEVTNIENIGEGIHNIDTMSEKPIGNLGDRFFHWGEGVQGSLNTFEAAGSIYLGGAGLANQVRGSATESMGGLITKVDDVTPESSSLVYRSGSNTDLNLTPRPQDTGGLSTFDSPSYFPPNTKYQTIDTRLLKELESVADAPPAGHVSIRPKDMTLMKEWIGSRGKDIHRLTEELKNAIIGTGKTPK
jgi:RHS repeat-associated protein